MQKHAPYLSGVAMLSYLKLVSKVESLLARMYNYFAQNPKRHLEFCKLVKILEPKWNKLLKNIKT
jgi:hypothetical protein